MDVKSAFLNGKLEGDDYIEQLDGFFLMNKVHIWFIYCRKPCID